MKNILKTGLSVAGLMLAFSSEATIVRAVDDGRTWQTVFDMSAPLEWRWADGAVSAQVTVSNLLRKTVATATVTKAENAKYGSYVLDYTAGAHDSGEALYDVVLVQRDGSECAVETQTARLAALPESFTVAKSSLLAKVKGRRTVAYDAAWSDDTAGTTGAYLAFKPAKGEAIEVDLAGTGGYFPSPKENGTLTLGFDSKPVWTGNVLLVGGLLLLFR